MSSKRFRVALSYPGERRDFVARVAGALADRFGWERVLYDKYFEGDFSRPNLDLHLQRLYHDEAELVVVFLCAEYESKEWCGLEWDAIRDLMRKRGSAAVMLTRFELVEFPGLYSSTAGFLDIGHRPPEDIAAAILGRLGESSGTPSGGQKIAPSRLPQAAAQLFGREAELALLHQAWQDPKTHVFTLVAWGGTGKTALVAKLAAQLAERDFDGADYFDWSFYSQGTRDHSTASADAFVDAALRHFGDDAMAGSSRGGWDKGARLAEILSRRRALLVLDGLEPLQHPDKSPVKGQIMDPAAQALLRGLAARNAGLCVITTRVPPTDLDNWRETAAQQHSLTRLSIEAGALLLTGLGCQGSATEVAKTVEEVDGHALTLNLLGRYLARVYGGDVRRRDRVRLSTASRADQQDHAFRVIEAYERWFEAEGLEGQRQLAILRLLGLFDRPATFACFSALGKAPPISGLTEALFEPIQAGWRGWFKKPSAMGEEAWRLNLSLLEEGGLIEVGNKAVDAHPLLREYFAGQLHNQISAWQKAHGRLFDFLKESTEYQPNSLAGIQPLYQAVYHGCQAGRQQEACDEIYRDRILRGTESDGFYSTKKLGALGADLGALACFFAEPWCHVSPSLTQADQGWLLNEAAFRLRGLGRLREALEPMRASLEALVHSENWANAAIRAGNLSELQLTLGELAAAVADAESAVTFADRSRDAFQRMGKRTTLADARHQQGEGKVALALFFEAERQQTDRQPEYPLFYSLQAFRYCDLLLAPAERAAGSGQEAGVARRVEECAEVECRAIKMFEWRVPGDPLLDIAIDHLTLGRARLYRAILARRPAPAVAQAAEEIEKAVAGLRAAGTLDHLPRGLLTRAWLRSRQENAEGARADLDEAEEIAERGSMRLHLADIALMRARLFGDRDALARAKQLVEECGYGRRRPEIADLEAKFRSEEIGLGTGPRPSPG